MTARFSINDYQDQGISGPFPLIGGAEAAVAYQRFFATLGQSPDNPQPAEAAALGGWHTQHRWAWELATHPSIVAAMKEILGEDLVLWAMRFWYKEPRSASFIPWHQDIRYWPMEPAVNATAWIALGPSLRENGCLRVIPGTHTKDYGHIELDDADARLGKAVDPSLIDESRAVDLEMSPGEAVVFSERLFHGSRANGSDMPRVAFSVRYTTPEVKFSEDVQWEGFQVGTTLVSGEDRYRRNDRLVRDVPAEWRAQ